MAYWQILDIYTAWLVAGCYLEYLRATSPKDAMRTVGIRGNYRL
ncbi:hypothetical protein AB8896_05260 [Yersinia enterocolitica]